MQVISVLCFMSSIDYYFPGLFHTVRCLPYPREVEDHYVQEFIQKSVS